MDLKNKTGVTSKNEAKPSLQEKLDHDLKLASASYIKEIMLLVIIATGLINTEYFYTPTTIAYYGFCISTLFFVIICVCSHSTNNKSIALKTPILLFGLWCFYILVHHFTNTGTLVLTIYSIALYFLLLKATAVFSNINFNFKLFFIGIAGIASVESIYCIGQFFSWLNSQNKLFIVTGSWNNPNVTAIFLALTVPVFLHLFKGKYKKIMLTGFLTLVIALALLKCRAAYIGTVLSAFVFYGLEYQIINWVKNKKNRTSAKALLIISLLIIIPVCSHLYNAKKASADGRKFIWKVSSIMATEKPITGYGYGYFEKEYNLYQANYIKSGKATPEELENAGPVIMPHNELLQNTVEGGIIGLILIVLFFGSLLFTVKQRKKAPKNELDIEATTTGITNRYFNLSYAGVVAFIGMSMVNSTIQIVPIICLLVIYAAIICSTLKPLQLPIKFSFIENNRAISLLSKTTIIAGSMYLLSLIFGLAIADSQNKKAKLLKESGQYEKALQIMPALEPYLKEDSHYWENYGVIYFKTENFQEAIACFKKAQTLSSLPEAYLGSGKSYEKLKQYPQAIQKYKTLVALYPPKFSYRMMLLKAYSKNKDKDKSIALAQEIIRLKPKIESEKVNQYKNTCRILLKRLGVPLANIKQYQTQSFK